MKAMNDPRAHDLTIIAASAALIIVLGGTIISIDGLGVPIVLQNMGIALARMILEFKRGSLATALFLVVGPVGIPNTTGQKPLLATLPGPTADYIVGHLTTGSVIGMATQQAPRAKVLRTSVFIGAGFAGVLPQCLFGPVGLAWHMGFSFTDVLITNVPFTPGSTIRVVVATLITTAVLQASLDLLLDATNRRWSRLVKGAATSGD